MNRIVIILNLFIFILVICIYNYPYYFAEKWFNIIKDLPSVKKIYRKEDFELIEDFEKSKNTITQEFLENRHNLLNTSDISDIENKLAGDDGMWKMAPVKILNRIIPNNFKETTRLVKKYEKEIGTVYFSLLHPGKYLPPHTGPINSVLRCHIPIVIPEGDIGLKVEDSIYKWEKTVLFDDTKVHSAWNFSKSPRVVLLIDIKKPLEFPFNVLDNIFISLGGDKIANNVIKMNKK